jgi:hypothetical protein
MNIIEIPVIGSRRSEKEKLYTLLSDQPLRKFQGLDVGTLNLDQDSVIYLYFMNQENEEYLYLWDLIIPRAIGSLVICDLGNAEIFDKNVEVIERMKERYATELFICSLPVEGEEPAVMKSKGLVPDDVTEFMYFNPQDKESAKKILLKIIEPDRTGK